MVVNPGLSMPEQVNVWSILGGGAVAVMILMQVVNLVKILKNSKNGGMNQGVVNLFTAQNAKVIDILNQQTQLLARTADGIERIEKVSVDNGRGLTELGSNMKIAMERQLAIQMDVRELRSGG
jgi:hypothetical protein